VLTATAAGGDGSYAYQWTITGTGLGELLDEGTCAQTTAGTLDAANGVYNTARFTVTIPNPIGGPPATVAEYRYKCTVTDGDSSTADGFISIIVVAQSPP